MKIDVRKLARVLEQIITATPVVVAAVKPVIDTVKYPGKGGR